MESVENFGKSYWWVILFGLMCFYTYEKGATHIDEEYAQLHRKLMQYKLEYEDAQVLREDLKLQINSQSDPEWIELTLMKGLGVVPEGQTKVYMH